MTFLSVQVVISPLVADSRESEPCDRVVIYLNVPYLSISRKNKRVSFFTSYCWVCYTTGCTNCKAKMKEK